MQPIRFQPVSQNAITLNRMVVTSGKEFIEVAAGKRLPSVNQLKKMTVFFNRTIEEILGISAIKK